MGKTVSRFDGLNLRSHPAFQGALVLCALAVAVVVLFHMPMNRVAASDLVLYFRPAAQAWLVGRDPYEVHGYVNPPWTLPLMALFCVGPSRVGYVLLFVFSFAVLAGAVRVFGGGLWTLLGILVAPPTVALLSLGQVDTWVLLGAILGCWAADRGHWAALGLAFTLLLIKPQVGGLVALLWVLTLPRSLTVKALAVLGVVWVSTCLAVGTWWPFGSNLGWSEVNLPESISVLHLARELGLPLLLYPVTVVGLAALWAREVLRRGRSDYTTALSLLVAGLSAPYVLRHSFTVSLATALVLVGRRSWPWAVVSYLWTWMPILSLWVDDWQRWWEIGAWWLLLAGLVFVGRGPGED